ncbi:hemicentin-1-like isoform X2 [Toxorhynchites rutilus septentrionalis]|uniref:hemicentin-1-like isoform X2 n=1 Tax=Toxorhynchites rutilus septentrionalis TaxID=329112 RepID=UPI00247964B3|nr:hemicentin-1-like isoform X2 [Toxorhynchites rutilus septentrionalis]
MRKKCLVLALPIVFLAIISTESVNDTDNDELWTLLVSGKLDRMKTKTSSGVTLLNPSDASIHSENTTSGSINRESDDKPTGGTRDSIDRKEEEDEQLFSWVDSAESLGSVEDEINKEGFVMFSKEGNSLHEPFGFDDVGSGLEMVSDKDGMQADDANFDEEIIDVLRSKPVSREMLGLLGLLKERNETEEIKRKMKKLLRPVTDRLNDALPSILEERQELPLPAEEITQLEPIEAESLISDGSSQIPPITNILLPSLNKQLPTIRKHYQGPSEGQRSLVIVFDATGSMLDDLNQLRDGAKLIIDEITLLQNNPIYNYVFVPFRDPQVGPRLVTRDKEALLAALEDLQIYGGGDCPEAALAALSNAIEVALPRSFIYVFTDATAKDFKLDQRVLHLIQQKQTPITFLLTGFCDGKNTPGHKVMADIAAASNGQIYDLKKDQIEQVLIGIKDMLNIDHVPLKSVDSNTAETHNISLNVDSTLKEFSVSVAGHRPDIEITDPHHTLYNNSKSVLDLENIKVVNVAGPVPGKWNIRAGSESSHSVRLSGNSDVKFRFGFSPSHPTALSTLGRQPLLNSDNILTIQASQPELLDNLSEVTITSHENGAAGSTNFKFTLPLTKILLEDSSIAFLTPQFKAPRQRFKISVSGRDISGNSLERLISTAIQAVGASPPELSLDITEVELFEGDDMEISCNVESMSPILVQWKRFNRPLVEETFNSTAVLKLHLENVTTKHSGRYVCHAANDIGDHEITATIKVKPHPEPVVGVYPKDIVAYEHEHLIALRCITHNVDAPVDIDWTHDGVRISNAAGKEYLELRNLTVADAGIYECQVNSQGKTLLDSTLLTVEYAPKASKTLADTVLAPYGQTLQLECGLSGNPSPVLTWTYRALDETEERQLSDEDDILILPGVTPEAEGFYTCEGRNRHGSTKRTVLVQGEADEPPRIPKPDETTLYVRLGARVVLNCSCDLCQPLSEYIWTNGRLTFESSPYDLQDNARVNLNVDQTRNAVQYQLTIDNFGTLDQGSYSCILSNAHGADSIVTEVRLMQAPQTEGILIDDELVVPEFVGLEGSVRHLSCDAVGLPEPHIEWWFNGITPQNDRRFSLKNDNKTLWLMSNFDRTYSGNYTCVASNPMGSATSELLLHYGSAPYFPEPSNMLLNAEVGDRIALNCSVVGIPEPDTAWYYNGDLMTKNRTFIATLEDSGLYTCNASNSFGDASAITTIVVYGKPQFGLSSPSDMALAVTKGKNISLECLAIGFPEPSISWTFGDQSIDELANVVTTDNGLFIVNTSSQHQGTYVCDAENSLGNIQKVYYLAVKEIPRITANIPDRIELLPHQAANLSCAGEGNPSPRGSWSKNHIPLPTGSLLTITYGPYSSGNYTCTLQNDEGSDTLSIEVLTVEPPTRAANVSNDDSQIQAKVDAPLTLVCPFDNYDSLLWQLNERNLDNYVDLTDIRLVQNILQIERLRQIHEGTYTCFAENRAGRFNHSFVVGILSVPSIEHIQSMDDGEDLDFDSAEGIAEVSLLSGDELRLVCHASGSPKPTVSWSKDGKVITRGSELTINEIDTHHDGLYTCVAENDLGSARKVYRLDVMTSPRHWGDTINHIEAFKGDDLQLDCRMSANPPASIQWNKDDITLEEFADVLEFVSIQPLDSGVYTCEAENLFGDDEKKFHVTVYQSPEITLFPENHITVVGDSLTIDCEAIGSPLPSISIIHKGEVLASTTILEQDSLAYDRSYRVKPKTYSSTPQEFVATRLSQFEIQFRLQQKTAVVNSAGKYLCLAQNAVGSDERLAKVEVFVPPYVQHSKLKAGPNYSILEGLPLYLFCPIAGHPKPTLSWYRNTKPIKGNGQTLFISSASRKDGGNYTCLGENPVGKNELSYSVNVLIPPTMINSIVLSDGEVADQPEQEEISILKGDNVTLDCASLGNPRPEVFWKKVIYLDENLNEQLPIKDAVLELYNIDSTSTYTCYVNNSAGATQKLFHIVVQSAPSFKKIEYDPKPTVSLHHTVDLNCEMLGVPEADVTWTKNELMVSSLQKGLHLASNGQILRISDARSADSGEYKCTGRNLHGQVSREFNLTVDVPVSWSPWGEWSACSASCGKGTQFRSRICLLLSGSPAQGKEYNCVGENIQVRNCEMLPCPVNGGWGAWGQWSNCSLNCVSEFTGLKSTRSRSRKCDSPPPSSGGKPCIGEEHEEEVCSVKFCPINGDWTSWTKWTPCSETCGFGRMIRWRSCANPAPRNGGLSCQGEESEIKICKQRDCIVNGGWSDWGSWSKCSKSCGVGVRHRKRSCNKPEPKNGGQYCEGENIEIEKCTKKTCRNDALLKHINRDGKRKFSPLLTYESNRSVDEEDDYSDNHAHPQSFKVIRNFEPAEAPPVEYVDEPLETGFNELEEHHQIVVSLKNTVNLTRDTAAYQLNLDGSNNSIEFNCVSGMSYNQTMGQCVDLNECTAGDHRCTGQGQICVNTKGGYECLCKAGFRMSSEVCVDINECRDGSHECSHYCTNKPGGYGCFCPAGFALSSDEKTCTRRKTREEPAFSIMNYEMICPEGYFLEGSKCVEIDECKLREDECSNGQSCLNTRGSYLCVPTACPDDYEIDELLGHCFKDCKLGLNRACPDGAQIEQTITFRVISVKKISPKQPLAVLAIPAFQHTATQTTFSFLERTYEHVFSLEKNLRTSGIAHLFATKKLQRGKIYKLKIIARTFGHQSGTMDYVHRFIVYVHWVD